MASKTLAELRADVRRKVREASPKTFWPQDVDAALNEALIELWARVRELDKGWTIAHSTPCDVQAGVAEYANPTGFYAPLRVEALENGVWIPLRKRGATLYRPSAAADCMWPPSHYVLQATTHLIWPTPNAARAKVLRWYGDKDATKLVTESQTSGLPQDVDEPLELGAAWRLLEIEESGQAERMAQRYMARKEEVLITLAIREPGGDTLGVLEEPGVFAEDVS